MRPTRSPRRFRALAAGSAAAALGLGLVAAGLTPATAAGSTALYSFGTDTTSTTFFGFTTLSPTTAAAQFLPTNSAFSDLEVSGAEICGGSAFAVGNLVGHPAAIMTWNTTTGATAAVQDLHIFPADVPGNSGSDPVDVKAAYDLDAPPGCTIWGLVEYTYAATTEQAIATIDQFGRIIPQIILPSGFDVAAAALATDPMTGTTLLLSSNGTDPFIVATVDLGAKTVGAAVPMTGLNSIALALGSFTGCDFDATGRLWMTGALLAATSDFSLVTIAPGAPVTSTVPTNVGDLPVSGSLGGPGPEFFPPIPLAADAAPATATDPTLAATGAGAAPLPLAGVLLLAGVAAVAVTRRRRALGGS